MCGRYVFNPDDKLAERFGLSEVSAELKANFNVTPESMMPIVIKRQERELVEAKWGLKPKWLQDKSGFINARAETLLSKPSFKQEAVNCRCIVPASGYFEWQSGKVKQPYYFEQKEMLGLAGIYNETETGRTFAIITRPAQEEYAAIHDRQPVIVPKSREERWLYGKEVEGLLEELLNKKEKLNYYPVMTAVNNPQINSEETIAASD